MFLDIQGLDALRGSDIDEEPSMISHMDTTAGNGAFQNARTIKVALQLVTSSVKCRGSLRRTSRSVHPVVPMYKVAKFMSKGQATTVGQVRLRCLIDGHNPISGRPSFYFQGSLQSRQLFLVLFYH